MSYSEKKFLDDIAKLQRWIERRRAVLEGRATARRIRVEGYVVPTYHVAGHYRTVIRKNVKRKGRR
jgi:hypothetical protein